MLRKQIYKLFFFILIFISSTISFGVDSKCQQVITISFYPKNGVKVYNVSGGSNDRRGIIDLGHFNQNNKKHLIEIGSVVVDIEMVEKNENNSNIEIPAINPTNLKNMITNNFEVTNFISGGNASVTVKADNFATILKEGPNKNGIYLFKCNGDHAKHVRQFKYRFDLILEITPNGAGMYGISIKKNNGGTTYLDIKELVLNQLKNAQQ